MRPVCILLVFSNFSIAQDIIHKKSGEEIKAKVLEIHEDEIKYQLWENMDGPLYTIDRNKILKIVFANGKTEFYQDRFDDPDVYADQKKQALKLNFISPLFGYTGVTYERLIKPGRSFEARVGFIGLGKNETNGSYNGNDFKRSPKGAFLGTSFKFFNKPDYYVKGMRYSHIMRGKYIRPELILGSYKENVYGDGWDSDFETDSRTIVYGAIMLNAGKQWIFSDVFLVDWSLGIGYAFDSNDDDNFFDSIVNDHFAIKKFGVDSNFAVGSSLKIGLLF